MSPKVSVRIAMVAAGVAVSHGVHADLVTTLSPAPITAPAALGYSNSTTSGLLTSVGTTATSPWNFVDRWTFTLADEANVSSFAATLNFTDGGGTVTQGIENLQLRLVGPSSMVIGWQTVQNYVGFQQVLSSVSPAPYAAGNYALEIRGTLVGPASSYAGTLVASPVPLPAALPMLAAGLGAFAMMRRRRRTAP